MGARQPVEVFDEWALRGKDVGMETGHAAAVDEMLAVALSEVASLGQEFTAIDAGCGNGWVVRNLRQMPFCTHVCGVDGAATMISKAKEIDPVGDYHHADLMQWSPKERVNLVHSMEVFYYLKDTAALLAKVNDWLVEGGYLVFGVDRYFENPQSHDWDQQVGCFMALHSEEEWTKLVVGAGFSILKRWRAAPRSSEGWSGTLAFLCIKD